MTFILFIVSITASTLGAIVGFGGGVIIKPVLDALGILPVSTISFLSGCTVLTMSLVSVFRSRNNGVKLDYGISTPLAIGSVVGGIVGKTMFEAVKAAFSNENVLGLIQAVVLVVMTTAVLLYVIYKKRIRSYHVKNVGACILIGVGLGIISAFLGIGGGPNNVAILFLCFSMDAKEAAKNSLYTIIFSQATSLILTLVKHTVPAFAVMDLVLMCIGGVSGALLGAAITKKLNNSGMEKILIGFISVIILINIYNCVKFSMGI